MRNGKCLQLINEKNVRKIDWSKDDLYPLTEKGREDMEKMSQEVDSDIDVILCSPVLRARESAEIINKKLTYAGSAD